MPKHYTILEQHPGTGFNSDNRYWKVEVAGKVYFAGVEQGKPVRIAFKRRGENRGYKRIGFVRDERGQSLMSGEVTKSTGLAYLLECAGLVPLRPSEMAKIHHKALWDDHFRERSRNPGRPGDCPCALCRKDV